MAREFAPDRYEKMQYRRCGRSGLKLPAISLGAWETFGGYRGEDVARECLFRAFDLGITHFDLANNYGTPPGNAEIVVGQSREGDAAGRTDHLQQGGLGDVARALWRLGLAEVPDRELRPVAEAHGRWSTSTSSITTAPTRRRRWRRRWARSTYLVQQGKALYAGVSNYRGDAVRGGGAHVRAHGPARRSPSTSRTTTC